MRDASAALRALRRLHRHGCVVARPGAEGTRRSPHQFRLSEVPHTDQRPAPASGARMDEEGVSRR